MGYDKTTWVDESLGGPERFDIQSNSGDPLYSDVQIALSTSVVTPGTGFTAENMNKIEDGIEAVANLVDGLISSPSTFKDGIICGKGNDMYTYADGSAMKVFVKTGTCHVQGVFQTFNSQTELSIDSAPATAGTSRYDIIAIEADLVAKTSSLKIVKGTAGASPALPSLTKSATVFQIPIAYAHVEYGVTTIAAAKVYPMHNWALGVYVIPVVIGSGLNVIATGVCPTGFSIPVAGKIYKVELVADASGSISLDLWKDSLVNYPPTVADTMCATSNKPGLSTQRFAKFNVWGENTNKNGSSLYMPGYVFPYPSQDVPDSNWVLVNVDSIATIKQVNMTLYIAKTLSPTA